MTQTYCPCAFLVPFPTTPLLHSPPTLSSSFRTHIPPNHQTFSTVFSPSLHKFVSHRNNATMITLPHHATHMKLSPDDIISASKLVLARILTALGVLSVAFGSCPNMVSAQVQAHDAALSVAASSIWIAEDITRQIFAGAMIMVAATLISTLVVGNAVANNYDYYENQMLEANKKELDNIQVDDDESEDDD